MNKQEIAKKIESLTKELESLKKYTGESDKKRSVYGLENGDTYYILASGGLICRNTKGTDIFDENRLRNGSVFLTQEEAEKERDVRQAIVRIKKTIYEQNFEFEPDYENYDQIKCYIYYSDKDKNFKPFFEYSVISPLTLPYLAEKEHAEYIIKNHQDDLKIIFGVK